MSAPRAFIGTTQVTDMRQCSFRRISRLRGYVTLTAGPYWRIVSEGDRIFHARAYLNVLGERSH
jgi:hypothetical protein